MINQNQTPFLMMLNIRGWRLPFSKEAYLQALNWFAEQVNLYSPSLVAIAEFKIGYKRKYLNYFLNRLLDIYGIVTPLNYDIDEHGRAAVNIMLVKKDDFHNVDTFAIGGAEGKDYAGLYNLVRLTAFEGDEPLFVLNTHQISRYNPGKPDEYVREREALSDEFWADTEFEVKWRADSYKMLFCGDLNCSTINDELKSIETVLKDTNCSKNAYTYMEPDTQVKHRFDRVYTNFGGKSYIKPTPNTLDHAMVLYYLD